MVDGTYWLIPLHATYTLAVAPRVREPHPALETTVFYANCLAYEYDVPAFVWNVAALVRPLANVRRGAKDFYRENMLAALEILADIRFGPLAKVELAESTPDPPLDRLYTAKYATVPEEISLYASALRQLDPLSEFLSYYRIIERISPKAHKRWIAMNLSRLPEYDFGSVKFKVTRPEGPRRRNLFGIYRRRALTRLTELGRRLQSAKVEDYFYHQVRCGIAHGERGVKVYDFGQGVADVAKDCYVLKLLARMGIEERV